MKISPFWLTRITFLNMNPFSGTDIFLVTNIVYLLIGVMLGIFIRSKALHRIVMGVLIGGWIVLEIIADIAAVNEVDYWIADLSITGGRFFLMTSIGYIAASLISKLIHYRQDHSSGVSSKRD